MLNELITSNYKYSYYGVTFKDNNIDSIKIYFCLFVTEYCNLFYKMMGYHPTQIESTKHILNSFPCIAIKIRKDGTKYYSFYHCTASNPDTVIGFDLLNDILLERNYIYSYDKYIDPIFNIPTVPKTTCVEYCEGTTIRNNKQIKYKKVSFIPALGLELLPLNEEEKIIYSNIVKHNNVVADCIDSEGYKAVYFMNEDYKYNSIDLFIYNWFPNLVIETAITK